MHPYQSYSDLLFIGLTRQQKTSKAPKSIGAIAIAESKMG